MRDTKIVAGSALMQVAQNDAHASRKMEDKHMRPPGMEYSICGCPSCASRLHPAIYPAPGPCPSDILVQTKATHARRNSNLFFCLFSLGGGGGGLAGAFWKALECQWFCLKLVYPFSILAAISWIHLSHAHLRESTHIAERRNIELTLLG